MTVRYKYNSADNHLDHRWIPRTLWQDRVAPRFRDAAPRVVEKDGRHLWSWEGRVFGGRDGGTADGPDNARLLHQFFGAAGAPIPPGSLPPSDPKLLLQHMDLGGIYGYVGFGGTRKWDIADPALRHEVHRVYNDWVMELNAADPDRLMLLPLLPVFDPPSVPKEIERLAAMGCRAAEFVPYDGPEPLFSPVWEPAWAALEETQMVFCAHIGGSVKTTIPPEAHGERISYFACAPFSLARPISDLVFGGALERHPGLKVLFAECRAGWIPFLIYWMDRQALERPGLFRDTGLKLRPSEYCRRQMLVTFEEDDIAAKLIRYEDCVLRDILAWGADYPHPQGTWPDPDPIFYRMFDGLDPAFRHEVAFERVRRVFRIKGPPADRLVPPEEAARMGAGRERAHANFE